MISDWILSILVAAGMGKLGLLLDLLALFVKEKRSING
jgi:hypothetical protein